MTIKRLVIPALVIGAGVWLARRRTANDRPSDRSNDRSNDGDPAEPRDPAVPPGRGVAEAAVPPGISDVDPEPLTQIAGEAVDPEAVRTAHESIRDQRDRLPVPGKNVP
jgi:hypothetical protein